MRKPAMQTFPMQNRHVATTSFAKNFLMAMMLTASTLIIAPEVSAAESTVATQATNRLIMQDLAKSLQWLLQYGIESGRDGDEQGSNETTYVIDKLSAAATMAEDHIGGTDLSRRKLGMALGESITELKYAIENKHAASISFHVSDMVDQCVACHARIPGSQDPLASKIFEIPQELANDRDFAAKYFVATRQFDRAMTLIEEDIVERQDDLAYVDLDGRFDDYLWVAIRLSQNPSQALEFLRTLSKTVDEPYYLARLIDRWITDLEDIEPLIENVDGSSDDRDFAYQLIDQSRFATQIPYSREGLVTDLAAATLLRARLEQPSYSQFETAELYYQLALIEAKLVGPDYSAPQMEFLLEAAIRAHPAGPRAKSALSILEEFGFHVSQESEFPEDRFQRSLVRFNELRALVESNRN